MGKENVASLVTQKLLKINPNDRYAHEPEHLEKRARDFIDPAEIYLEDEPSIAEWLKDLVPTGAGVAQYSQSLFPPISWLKRYNASWLLGDMIAGKRCQSPALFGQLLICSGITIGLVVVPQAMAYALLAGLKPAFGLYTSFTGAILYWVFGTSKDIVIGVSKRI